MEPHPEQKKMSWRKFREKSYGVLKSDLFFKIFWKFRNYGSQLNTPNEFVNPTGSLCGQFRITRTKIWFNQIWFDLDLGFQMLSCAIWKLSFQVLFMVHINFWSDEICNGPQVKIFITVLSSVTFSMVHRLWRELHLSLTQPALG